MADSPGPKGENTVRITIFSEGNKIDETYGINAVKVTKSINKIPLAKIILSDGNPANQDFPISDSDDFKPGKSIKINAGYGNEEETIFEGIVIKHGLQIRQNSGSKLVIDCRDKAVKMTVGRKNANFVDSKDSDVFSKLIGNYGLSLDVKDTNSQHKELVQYYCSDWDFMLSRADVNGYVIIVDDGSISVKPPETSESAILDVSFGEDIIEFDAEVDSKFQLSSVTCTAWDPSQQKISEQTGSRPSINAQGNLSINELSGVIGLSDYKLESSCPLEATAMKAWADACMLKTGLARIKGRMKFQGNSNVKPGKIISLNGVGSRFNGPVYVSSVHHNLNEGEWITEINFGLSSEWFSENANIVAPPASGFLPGVEGLQIGVVKKLDEDPENEFRVQVSVPIMKNDTNGIWARLATFYASNSIGAFFIPEVGDEVILGYLNNDPCYPVIIGSVYSSKNPMPYTPEAENNTKALVTRSNLKIEFDEEKKKTSILTPGGNLVVLDDDSESILLQDKSNNKIELSSSGIVLDSPKDIKISAKGKISIDSVGELSLSSKADVKITGLNINSTANVGYTAKGNASAELSAAGQTTIKGAMVMIN